MLKKYMKCNNLMFYFLLILIYISFFLINVNVVNYGDDYYFMQYRNYNFKNYFNHLFSFYLTDNGRFIIHLLVTFFLRISMFFWQIFNSFMLTVICFLISKITSDNSNNKTLILIISFFLISSIEIIVTRQSIYWLTGSLNYVYPCVLLLFYTYLLKKIKNNKIYILALMFGFLSASSMEQSALMTVLLTFLILMSKFNKSDKLKQNIINNKRLIILLIITSIGACSVLFAPSQFNRIQLETQNMSLEKQIFENIKLILKFYTQSTTIFYFEIIFLLSMLIYIFQYECNFKRKIIFVIINIIGIILLINLCFFHYFVRYLKYIYIFLLIILLIYFNKKTYNRIVNPLNITIALIITSQGIMIISPVFGYRNLIFGLIMLIFINSLIISRLNTKQNFKKILCVVLLIYGLLLNFVTARGYYSTKLINEKNIAIVKNSDKDKTDSTKSITLFKFLNDDYSWCPLYSSEFHLEYFKKAYKINCNIEWK